MRLRSLPVTGSAAGEVPSHRYFRPAVIAPILLVGAGALFFKRRRLLHRLFEGERGSLNRAHRLSRAILGNNKHSIAIALGAPQAAADPASARAVDLANTWYYRLDSRHHIAIAIEFSNDVACDVRVLHVEPHAGVRNLVARSGMHA